MAQIVFKVEYTGPEVELSTLGGNIYGSCQGACRLAIKLAQEIVNQKEEYHLKTCFNSEFEHKVMVIDDTQRLLPVYTWVITPITIKP